MALANGRLPPETLAAIPGGRLSKSAARGWNAPGGPADAGLMPTGSRSSYRSYADQEHFYDLYLAGKGNLAAFPGTSNHGLGISVDLREPWMRAWVDEHGAPYGWAKTEAFSEWWHVNFVGGIAPSILVPTLKRGDKGRRVQRFTRRLAFVRRPHGKPYLPRWYWRYKPPVERAVRAFQRDHDLYADGKIGPKTAAKIDAVFRRQYQARHDRTRKGTHSPKRAIAIDEAIAAPAPKQAAKRPVWKLSYAARFIAKWEGYLPESYLDTIAEPDVWTGGHGHTGPDVKPGQHWSKARSMRVLITDVRWAAKAVARNVKVPLTRRQRIALISLVFNCGSGAIDGSTLQRKLNRRDYKGAADEFLRWSHAGGVVVAGLLNRRKEERWMFLNNRKA